MPAAPFSGFLRLGVEHILTGCDHLVFLAGLLAGCRDWRPLVLLLTCFTLGHSITLALATVGWVALPARVSEPLIAATIVAVGLENLRRGAAAPSAARSAATVAFGLAHGFGFAGVLRDLGVGRAGSALALPLLGFNLGVELGQLAAVALVLPGFVWLRRRPAGADRILPALSLLVTGLGLYWLVERLWSAAS